jgi:p-aminobenzoyl-glutamate transporter AbgT
MGIGDVSGSFVNFLGVFCSFLVFLLFGLTDAEAKMIMQKWVVAVDARWYGGQFGG